MEHYFSETPTIKSENIKIKYKINDEIFEFISDNGVFSKSKIDFGTDFMLKEFIKENKNGKFSNKEEFDILDIGCGYGVISVVLKYFYKKSNLTLSDVNERALELSKKNLKKYKIEEYNAVKSFIFDNINKKFDVILSNPPIRAGKKTIFEIYEKSFEHLNKNGVFYCVIQTKHGAKSTQKKLEEIFSNCRTVAIDNGYRVYKSVKLL